MQQIRIDFDNPGLPQSLGAVEGESQSRIFQAALYKSGAAYTAPAGAVYSIMYRGFGPQNQGWYDTLEDGAGKRAACTVSGNVVTCELARQALRVPGHLTVVLCLTDAKGYMLKSWPIMADVRNDGYEDTGESEMYFNLSGIAGNYLAQLEKAMADAETTRNNLISTSAQAKKDIDAKAAAALKSIPESYTELDGNVKQLTEATADRFSLTAFDNGYLTNRYNPLIFENGYILNDGSDGAETKLRIRSKKYVPFFNKALVTDKKIFNFTLYKYDANGVFVESYKNLKETLSGTDINFLYRISVVRDDNGAITPADNPIMLLYKKNEIVENEKLEKSLIKKIESKIDDNDVEMKAYINGAFVESQSRLITKFYYLFDNDLFVRNNGKYTYSVYYYDVNFNYLDNLVWSSKDRSIDSEKPSGALYIKFGVKTSDDSVIDEDYKTVLDNFRIVNRFNRPFISLSGVPTTYYEGNQSEYNFDTNKNASEYLEEFKKLIAKDTNATVTTLGNDSSGAEMFAYTIKPASILYEKLSKNPHTRPKILIVSGQHGFEKGSVYGLYYFAKDLIENYTENEALAYIRGNVELSIIPIANRYGFDNNLYQNANDVNLNRNYEDGFVAGDKKGNTALDQPETKLIDDWIKSNNDALFLIDFHTNGKQVLTDWKNVNWLSIPYIGLPYSDIVYDACTRQISDNTVRFKKEFGLTFGKDTSLGRVDEWKSQPCLDSQAVLNSMIGITCEGFPAFVGAESVYDADSMKANSEIIGNIILNLLRGFEKIIN
nr:MAG TPA: peptidase [Bacteriophage sp.]